MSTTTVSKIDLIKADMDEEAAELLDRLLTTKHQNGKFVVSAPALAELLRTTMKTEISKDAVWRYRSKFEG